MKKNDRQGAAERKRTATADMAPRKANPKGGAQASTGGKLEQPDVVSWQWGIGQRPD